MTRPTTHRDRTDLHPTRRTVLSGGAAAAGLAAVYHLALGEDMDELYTYTMAPVTAENVDEFYVNVVSDKDAFLDRIADVVDRNLESGRIEDES